MMSYYWTLPEGDADFALYWRLIKSAFRMLCPEANGSPPAASPKASGGFGSGGIGSIRCATRTILRGTSIAFTQSSEAWPHRPRAGLAIFLVSPLGAPRCLSGGLGRR